MAMISKQFPNLLVEGLRTVFWVEYNQIAQRSPVSRLFNIFGSSKSKEEMQGVGGLGDWDEFAGNIEYDTFDQLYKTTFTPVEFTKGIAIERALIDDEMYGVMNQRVRILAQSAARKREKDAASIFNNAFSSSYTGGDSTALCYASHPLSPSRGGTHGNAGTTALSYDAVKDTVTLGQAFVDARGELLPVTFDTLVVPTALAEPANAIVKTMNKPETADHHANAFESLNVVVWPYLTDANNWFMMDSQMARLHLHWIDRVPLEFAEDPASDFNLVLKMRGYMRYAYGWSDWRWLYGHDAA